MELRLPLSASLPIGQPRFRVPCWATQSKALGATLNHLESDASAFRRNNVGWGDKGITGCLSRQRAQRTFRAGHRELLS